MRENPTQRQKDAGARRRVAQEKEKHREREEDRERERVSREVREGSRNGESMCWVDRGKEGEGER